MSLNTISRVETNPVEWIQIGKVDEIPVRGSRRLRLDETDG